ncbi:MAG: hypothetical protein K1X66_08450 [Verrucomicrobiae bacterium]|nr:hypothetical protein [Verrucomicrobiae bacterium]
MAENSTVPPALRRPNSTDSNQRMAQIFKNYEGPKFSLLNNSLETTKQVAIADLNKETRFYFCYELDGKFYYVDYNSALKLSLDKKVLNLAKSQHNGAIFAYNGNLYTKAGYLLVAEKQITRVGNNFYYPDANAKKLNVSELKQEDTENFFKNNKGDLYEKRGDLYFDYIDNNKVYNAQGELLRPIQNQSMAIYYPFGKPTGVNSRYTSGGGDVNPQETSQAFYVRMKDTFWDETKTLEEVKVSLNINSFDGRLSNRVDIILKRQADGTFISDPLAFSYYQAEPGDRLTLSYSTIAGETVTVPVGEVAVEKVIELDLFIPIDKNTSYSLAKAQEQIDYAKQKLGVHGIQLKVNIFAADKPDMDISRSGLSRAGVPVRLTEKFPQSKGIKMMMTPGQDNQGLVFLRDNSSDLKSLNSFFVAPDGHPQRPLTDDYTLKALVKITTGLDVNMYDTKNEFVLTSDVVKAMKASSFAKSPTEITQQPALTP